VAALRDRLREELNASRKAQHKAVTLVLGSVLADIENFAIAQKRELTDDDIVEVLRKGVKRRRESVDAFQKAGRAELAAQEQLEIDTLERFLPAQVSDDDLRAAVRSAIAEGATAIGAVMGKVTPQFKGRAEGSTISRIAREELGAKT
jgi:uncharacterized protein YqeY